MPSNALITCSVCCAVAGDERRQRCLRHLDRARCRIKTLAEIAAEVLVDQRLQHRVLGQSPRGRDATARDRRRLRQTAQKCATAGMALVRLLGHCISRIPLAYRLLAEANCSCPPFKLATPGKTGGGRICDQSPNSRLRRELADRHRASGPIGMASAAGVMAGIEVFEIV